MNPVHCDALIVGGGLVGAASALALARAGFEVALIDRARAAPPADAWDPRVYALTPANREALLRLGVWLRMDATRVQPVWRMDVAGDAGGRIVFDAYDAGVDALAYIVEGGRLLHALWQTLEEEPGVTFACPAEPVAFARERALTRIVLGNGTIYEAALVVGADGARSRVRDWAGIAATQTPYGHAGVVAHFACEKPHRGSAFQWFADGGVLAYLPLPANLVSIVWSCPEARARALCDLEGAAFAETVSAAGGHALGALTLATPPQRFPLARLAVETPVAPGVALVGDAAHGIHPLAGQGMNLGLADAWALAGTLAGTPASLLGDARVLGRYARARAEAVARMGFTTDGLFRLFAMPGAQWVRNAGMRLVDRAAPLKSALVRAAFE